MLEGYMLLCIPALNVCNESMTLIVLFDCMYETNQD